VLHKKSSGSDIMETSLYATFPCNENSYALTRKYYESLCQGNIGNRVGSKYTFWNQIQIQIHWRNFKYKYKYTVSLDFDSNTNTNTFFKNQIQIQIHFFSDSNTFQIQAGL